MKLVTRSPHLARKPGDLIVQTLSHLIKLAAHLLSRESRKRICKAGEAGQRGHVNAPSGCDR
jgi:hypothetical protein